MKFSILEIYNLVGELFNNMHHIFGIDIKEKVLTVLSLKIMGLVNLKILTIAAKIGNYIVFRFFFRSDSFPFPLD